MTVVSPQRYLGHKVLQGLPVATLAEAPLLLSIPAALTALGGLCWKAPSLSSRSWQLLQPYLYNGIAIASTIRAVRCFFNGSVLSGLAYLVCALSTSCLADRFIYQTRVSPNRHVVFAGSFDPPTKGHEAVLERLAQQYDGVCAVVAVNPSKTYTVAADKRVQWLNQVIEANPALSRVRAASCEGYVFDFAIQNGIGTLARGMRDEKDWWDEQRLKALNFLCAPQVQTHLFTADPKWIDVSSTRVRRAVQAGETIAPLVPGAIASEVAEAYL
ncbi:MAG: pantetheine-phosphate adenylyltransferase [Chlamydiia bacterium]|nr:pantetheine-phosphate adenylyltransferase [Chlamydiia bacterium]